MSKEPKTKTIREYYHISGLRKVFEEAPTKYQKVMDIISDLRTENVEDVHEYLDDLEGYFEEYDALMSYAISDFEELESTLKKLDDEVNYEFRTKETNLLVDSMRETILKIGEIEVEVEK